MALFNKIFSSRKRNYKYQDNVCEKLFQFTNDQVRVVLFRECDFRGRKLLFDSHAIQKVPLANGTSRQQETDTLPKQAEKEKKTYAETSNGFGYLYSKPNTDTPQLSEMIFGSVAMSYRGTSYKIHSLSSPSRFMCTQVFPCPRQTTHRGRNSAPGRTSCGTRQNNCNGTSSLSLEHSSKLEDSSTSCTTSFSDQSVHSTASDTLLVCRRNRSVPLDVPQTNGVSANIPNFSVVGDSGFCGDQFCSSYNSSIGPQSFPHCDALASNGHSTRSSGSLYKRWLRSASTSLEYSATSLTASASADECYLKPHPRTRKLGIAIIVELTNGQEEQIQKFLLEHAALVEALVWRVRQGSEIAFLRHANFLSLMSEVTSNTARWFIAFLTGPHLSLHMWRCLSSCSSTDSNCDNSFSIGDMANGDSDICRKLDRSLSQDRLTSSVCSGCNLLSASSECSANVAERTSEFTFLNLSRFFRGDCDGKKCEYGDHGGNRSFLAEKFVRELCELLESVDVKHTNFFISTLVTAVLTHHLGWVATVLDVTIDDEEAVKKLQRTGNPLWGQLNDLYGAVGSPTKMAHTIITGSNKPELIAKMLNCLTYFIRCNDVSKKSMVRWDIKQENRVVDRICKEKRCIPKENYKKYQDHLDEMAVINTISKEKDVINGISVDLKLDNGKINRIMRYSELKKFDEMANDETSKEEAANARPSKGLSKTTSCLSDLSDMDKTLSSKSLTKTSSTTLTKTTTCLNDLSKMIADTNEPSLEVESLSANSNENFGLTNEDIHRKIKTLFRGVKDSPKCHSSQEICRFGKVDLEKQRSSSSSLLGSDQNKNVVFVLGDDEELVGLKKNDYLEGRFRKGLQSRESTEDKTNSNENIPTKKLFRTESSDSSTEDADDFSNSLFKDADFVKYGGNYDLKPSTSWTHLEQSKTKEVREDVEENACSSSTADHKRNFIRSQSEPPEHIDTKNNASSTKPKFKYTGVKFNFQQHPQIFTNYMRSKNIELSNLSFSDKAMKFNGELSTHFDFTKCDDNFEEVEALQTPSNASELESTSELSEVESIDPQHAKESVENAQRTFKRSFLTNTVIKEPHLDEASAKCVKDKIADNSTEKKKETEDKTLKLIELPMPKSIVTSSPFTIGYTSTLFRGISDCYTSDMVLQGVSVPKTIWETSLRKDLGLTARHPLLDQPVEEAIAIVADTDTWEVQLMSSHTYVIDKGSSGVRIGMSQLVANMLESLLHMWKLHTPPEYCLRHIEQRLQEFCARSKALAQMLLATDFCSMDLLTASLQLEVNDVPLLMAVASTHSPQIMEKYGLSFQ